MQDKSNNILIDKGWDAMELILDKEMPQKKKRRFLIWWLFGGALLLAAYALLQYNSEPQESKLTAYETVSRQQSIETASQESELIKPSSDRLMNQSENNLNDGSIVVSEQVNVDKYIRKDNPSSTTINKEVVANTLTPSLSPQKHIGYQKVRNEKITYSNSNQVLPQSTRNVAPKDKESATPKNNGFINKAEKLSALNEEVQVKLVLPKPNKSNEDITSVAEDQGKIKRNLVDVSMEKVIEEPLKTRLLLQLSQLIPASAFEELSLARDITIVKPEAKKSSYWYGRVGGHLSWGPGERLYGMGMQIDFGHSFHGAIDLGATLGLGSFRYGSSTNNQTAINTVGRDQFSKAEAANVVNSSLSNVSHLDLGIHLGYDLSRLIKLRVDGGASYLFSSIFNTGVSEIDASLDVNEPQGIPTGTSMEGQEVMVENERGAFTELVYDVDQKWFPYAGLGLQININKKVVIDLGYQKVFGKLFEASANPLSMDRIKLGINYRFYKSANKQ